MQYLAQAILIDVEGVLIESQDVAFQSLNQALIQKGWCITRQHFEQQYAGRSFRYALEAMSHSDGFPQDWISTTEALAEQFAVKQIRSFYHEVPAMLDLFQDLRNSGFAVAVCGGLSMATTTAIVDQLGLTPYIDIVLGDSNDRPMKPSPAYFRSAAEHLGVTIESCVCVVGKGRGLDAADLAKPLGFVSIDSPADLNIRLVAKLLASSIENELRTA